MSDISRAQSASENLYKHAAILEEHFQVDSLYKVIQKVHKLESEIKTLSDTVKEFISVTQTSNKGDAKQRIQALMARHSDLKVSLFDRYNLDCTFLEGIGECWDKAGETDTPEEIRNFEKKIAKQRETVKDAYFYFAQRFEDEIKDAPYTEDEIRVKVTECYEVMREDFDLLTATQFWMEYRGMYMGIQIAQTTPETVPLVEAIRLVQTVAPSTLYAESTAAGKVLGDVPNSLFQRWEARAQNAIEKKYGEGREELCKLMADILGVAIHRLTIQEPYLPTAIQNVTLQRILLPSDYNPYGAEYCIGDDTTLSEVMGYYMQNLGTSASLL